MEDVKIWYLHAGAAHPTAAAAAGQKASAGGGDDLRGQPDPLIVRQPAQQKLQPGAREGIAGNRPVLLLLLLL